jgi:predicted nucleic acid-binding protein
MDFDLARALRRIKPEKWTGGLPPRPAGQLDFTRTALPHGPTLLLDTCVYIDVLQARLPPDAKALLKTRTVHHVSVVLGELSHLFGRLPGSTRSHTVLNSLSMTLNAIAPRNIGTPGPGIALHAGILCGLVFRLGGFQRGQEVAALNDATIYLHALDNGHAVLTRNQNDFDRMNQILPDGRVLFYDPT